MEANEKFETKKSLGQHFLNSAVVPRWMCDAADIAPQDIVLEIGPGTGALTQEILNRGGIVIALEADLRAIAVLTERFSNEIAEGRLYLHHIDVRTVDLQTIPLLSDHQFKVVANIPYYLSGFLFREMLETTIQPNTLVFLVQKEVAKRIASHQKGDKESLLSLSVKVFGEPRYVHTVSRGHFSPPPKVDSGIIAVTNITRDHFIDLDPDHFFMVLHIGFGQKRKQLLGNLSKYVDRDTLIDIFSTVGIDIAVRAEDVPLEKWLTLAKQLPSLQSAQHAQ